MASMNSDFPDFCNDVGDDMPQLEDATGLTPLTESCSGDDPSDIGELVSEENLCAQLELLKDSDICCGVDELSLSDNQVILTNGGNCGTLASSPHHKDTERLASQTGSDVSFASPDAPPENNNSDPCEVEITEELLAVIDELKRSLQGLSWKNIFPSANIDEMTKSEIEDLIACADPETLQKYYARSQTINGSENMESILKFLEFFEMACVHIDPIVQKEPEVEKLIQKCRDRHVPLLMLPYLSKIVADKDYLNQPNCKILGFKKCIKNKQSCFQKLYRLSRKASKNKSKQRIHPSLSGQEQRQKQRTQPRKGSQPKEDVLGTSHPDTFPNHLLKLLPTVHPEIYPALTRLLKASLYGLRYKDGFKPRNLYYKLCQKQEEDFFVWCRRNYPQAYPIVEARSHLKIADNGGEKTVMKDIYSNRIILLYIRVPLTEAFALKKIVLACYNKSIPILPIRDFSDIVGDPSTLFLPDCPALGLRESVLNRKSGFYGLYKLSCEAIGKIPRPEFPYSSFHQEWDEYLKLYQAY